MAGEERMAGEELKSMNDYERLLDSTVASWSPERRAAFAAAMAERWLPAYGAFSDAEEWGDPSSLRAALDAVWDNLRGRTLSRDAMRRHLAAVEESTPHMDDFEAFEALAACSMVDDALRASGRPDQGAHRAWDAAFSGFVAVAPEWSNDPEDRPRGLWTRPAVRKELRKQLGLIERIGALSQYDDQTIAALRGALTGRELVGEAPPRAPAAPATVSNQTLFEQYRRMVEADVRNAAPDFSIPGGGTGAVVMMRIAPWLARYSRRRQTIDGSYGRPTDVIAQQAVVARQRAHDAAEKDPPAWDPEFRRWIDVTFNNPQSGLDVRSVEEPHAYGPSLRRLWAESKRRGESDDAAWKSIVAWARHRPTAWAEEDQRRKKKGREQAQGLHERLAREVTWAGSGDVDHPWAAEVGRERWQVRVNDFPDAVMYTLVVNGAAAGDFHDWPTSWRRD